MLHYVEVGALASAGDLAPLPLLRHDSTPENPAARGFVARMTTSMLPERIRLFAGGSSP
jgi:hypothetical protein